MWLQFKARWPSAAPFLFGILRITLGTLGVEGFLEIISTLVRVWDVYRFWRFVCLCVSLIVFAFCLVGLFQFGLFAGTTSKENLGITEINTVRE